MNAKKSEPKTRKLPVNTSYLADAAEKMRAQAAEMISWAKAIEKSGRETIDVDGVQKIDRAVVLYDEFFANVKKALAKPQRASQERSAD
jgi:hypothetical protein